MLLTSLRLLFYSTIIFLGIVYLLGILAVSYQPTIQSPQELNSKNQPQTKQVLNPELKSLTNNKRVLELSERDINRVTNYLVNTYIESTVSLKLFNQKIEFFINIKLPKNIFGHYLNIHFFLNESKKLPTISELNIGKIYIPEQIANLLVANIIHYSALNEYYLLANHYVSNIHIKKHKLSIIYSSIFKNNNPHDELFNINKKALAAYQQKLIETVNHHNPKQRLSLATLFKSLFQLAIQRSKNSSAIEENRAVIFAVNSYTNKQKIEQILPKNNQPLQYKYLPVYMYQRVDLSQHFMGSAALTISSNAFLAYLIGQEKERRDSLQSSGFSFVDLAANRAGIHFAKIATQSEESAVKIQILMAKIEDYKAFMPYVLDFPEKLSQKLFKRYFISIYSSAYKRKLDNMDQRIRNLPIYEKD